MCQIIQLNRHRHFDRNRFIQVPYKLYRNDHHWIAPFRFLEHERLSNRDPFYAYGDATLFVAQRAGKDVGRIAAIQNRRFNTHHHCNTYFFGFFECENNIHTAQCLFDAVFQLAKKHNATRLLGPLNPSIDHNLGVLVNGHNDFPLIDMPYNPDYYDRLLKSLDFKKETDLIGHSMPFQYGPHMKRLKTIATHLQKKHHAYSRPIDLKNFKSEMNLLMQVYKEGFTEHWGYVPLEPKEFLYYVKDLKSIAIPEMCHFVFIDHKVAGFICVVYNLNETLINKNNTLPGLRLLRALWRKKTTRSVRLSFMGVKQAHQKKGLESMLYFNAFQGGLDLKKSFCENGWMVEDNHLVLRASTFMGGQEFRRYRIYQKRV